MKGALSISFLGFLLEVGSHFFPVLFGLELPARAEGWCVV